MTAESDLLGRIAEATLPIDAACLRAELACYHARMGQYSEAQALIQALRSSTNWSSARLAGLIFVAEGLVGLRNEYDNSARDRLVRAFAIASAFQEKALAGLAAAWLAQAHFNRLEPHQIAKWAAICLGLRDSMDKPAKMRLCLTQASIHHLVGDRVGGDAWFRGARTLAVDLCDESAIAAAMYNRSALGIARARLEWAMDLVVRSDLAALGMEIESAIAYSGATRNESSRYLHQLWHGRLRMLRSDFEGSIILLQDSLLQLPEAAETQIRIGIECDLALCNLELQKTDICGAILDALPPIVDTVLQPDDQVVYYRQLTVIAKRTGREQLALECNERLESAVSRMHTTYQDLAASMFVFEPAWAH